MRTDGGWDLIVDFPCSGLLTLPPEPQQPSGCRRGQVGGQGRLVLSEQKICTLYYALTHNVIHREYISGYHIENDK